jgi:hypothetical protein
VGVHVDRDQPHRQVIIDDKAHQLLQEGDALGELAALEIALAVKDVLAMELAVLGEVHLAEHIELDLLQSLVALDGLGLRDQYPTDPEVGVRLLVFVLVEVDQVHECGPRCARALRGRCDLYCVLDIFIAISSAWGSF